MARLIQAEQALLDTKASDISCAESSTTGGHSHDRQRPNIRWRVARVVIPVHNIHGLGEPHIDRSTALDSDGREPVKGAAVRTQGFGDHNRQLHFVQKEAAAQADVDASEYVPMGLSMLGKGQGKSGQEKQRRVAAKKGKGGWRPERQRQRRQSKRKGKKTNAMTTIDRGLLPRVQGLGP